MEFEWLPLTDGVTVAEGKEFTVVEVQRTSFVCFEIVVIPCDHRGQKAVFG